ncbi:MAG: hypothetical protein PHG27_03300 [Massilibacteroides sp.]|nr:hypothetical protein [Massilibacteroides sp.]MDD3061265.1 hypothetical protein [Massilibacteroides sp.]MDD4114613.1 hypothetical protein [Massilibacteroides sp.]MDD4659762.1 hypothetical protein [Massilibacteroides sp.]
MKKIVLMFAILAGVAFTVQNADALTVVQSVENVNQDEFVKIEVKDLPQLVVDAVLKANEGATIKEAFVSGTDADKKFKVVAVSAEGEELTLIFNGKGEIIS